MRLQRTKLRLFESDAESRQIERAYQAEPGNRSLRGRLVRQLRRAGRDQEADAHEIHLVGRDRAEAHDHETRMKNRRDKAHRAANASYESGDTKDRQGLRDKRRDAFDAYQKASREHGQLADRWHALAGRVHDAGGNAALAYYRPSLQSAEDHRKQMAQHIANRNQVKVNHDHVSHHVYTAHAGNARERHERVGRATREARAALSAHHSDTNPTVHPAKGSSTGGTEQMVHLGLKV